MENNVSLDLMEFIEQKILPRYAEFDKAHNLAHANGVIRRSLEIARRAGADLNMAYAIAAYHDLGLDARLKRWFSIDQLKVMKEAVEDHRASASHAPRSIYGKIVAEADRDLEPISVFRRTVQFGLSHYPEKSKEEHWLRFMGHMDEKYSNHGYIRLWMPNSPNEEKLNEIRRLISQPQELRKIFDRLFEEETTA